MIICEGVAVLERMDNVPPTELPLVEFFSLAGEELEAYIAWTCPCHWPEQYSLVVLADAFQVQSRRLLVMIHL